MNQNKVAPSNIIKQFNAPRQLVFDALTNVQHLNNWMFPMQGCSCEFIKADIKTGGSLLHKVTMPNGHEMWVFTEYQEVSSPKKLVFYNISLTKMATYYPWRIFPIGLKVCWLLCCLKKLMLKLPSLLYGSRETRRQKKLSSLKQSVVITAKVGE